jgi:isorenieratene synthase
MLTRECVRPTAGRPRLAPRELTVAVVGGGLAGLAAACILVERGARVIVYEKDRQLGGRIAAWGDAAHGVGRFEMERGFHAFFRQYYNVRALLRRIDPSLGMLVPLDDYPILAPDGAQSFAKPRFFSRARLHCRSFTNFRAAGPRSESSSTSTVASKES